MRQLDLPDIFKRICGYANGLILVTGPSGSGKTTTLAAMLDHINQTREQHIITIEDPIEFVHRIKRSLINQRELHTHTQSVSHALRAALREDPDVILIGELRDIETIRLALTAAETGHLVLATLHTLNAVESIHRLIDVFPAAEKDVVRTMLAAVLHAVIGQVLLPKIIGGRIVAQEILLCNAAVRNLIRKNKLAQIYSQIQTGAKEGMRTMKAHVEELQQKKIISQETAAKLFLHEN